MHDSHYVLVCKTRELLLKISTLTDRQHMILHYLACLPLTILVLSLLSYTLSLSWTYSSQKEPH